MAVSGRMANGKAKGGRSTAVPATMLVIVVSVMAVVLMAVLFVVRWTPVACGSGGDISWVSAGARVVFNAVSTHQDDDIPSPTVAQPHDDVHLGGLLSPDFDDGSCLSRYRAALYRQKSPHIHSSHLVSTLRRYEARHRLCGPGTSAYARAAARLRAPPSNASDDASRSECKYLIWSPIEGLGNRILSITSAFLYALLTDRVLLLHRRGDDLDDLFCEPFPGTTWILPGEDGFGAHTNTSAHSMLGRRGEDAGGAVAPAWAYVNLKHDYTRGNDRRFFCDDGQDALRRVGWLVLRSDNYFAPGLFVMPRHERELSRLFPRRDAVFHHLGRYLFHPSNTVWGMVARYHGAYLHKAQERVGVQVRVFSRAPISQDELSGQITSCAHGENILPGVRDANATDQATAAVARSTAVLVVSLYGESYERMKDMYYEKATAGGGTVSVYQPTHLGGQRSGERRHNQKAFAEMILLGFCDVLVTSAASTFGYVSQGLAGLRPWVLMRPVDTKAPDPPCRLAATIEPCFHTPQNYDCRTGAAGDTGRVVRHVRHCEDVPGGVQLVE